MQSGRSESSSTNPLDSVPEHLRDLSVRAEKLKAHLNQLKQLLPESTSSSHPSAPQLPVDSIRQDLRKARETIQHFKSLLLGSDHDEVPAQGAQPTVPHVARTVQALDDPSKPLIDRIGGEIVLETIVETVYSRFLEDVRLRAYFEKPERKIAQIKRRFYLFLLGYIGGKVSYDEANLKPAHYHLNITNYHFDAVLEIFDQIMLNDLKIHANATRDFISTIARVRADITTGYTIRSEIARINTMNPELLFNRIGDLDGIIRFIDKLYEVVAKDARIRNFFVGASFEKIKHGQRAYITQLLGGPKIYKGRSMEEIHLNLGITDYHFDCWLQDVDKALTLLNMDESVIDQVIVQFESVRPVVLVKPDVRVPEIPGRLQAEKFDSVLSSGAVSSRSFRIGLEETGKPGPTLLSLLGGEQNVESLVEHVYNACFADPRLRFFFPTSKARAEVFKRGFTNACITVSGGPVMYDLTNLRHVHQKMNVTDFHFDTLMSVIESCATGVMGIKEDLIKELVTRLSLLRQDITAGCTVRYELAKQRTESGVATLMNTPNGIRRVIDQLYRFVKADPRINTFFQGASIDTIIHSQSKFLSQLFGGSDLYTGPEIRKVHARLNVADYHFEVFLDNMARAVRHCGFPQEVVDECFVCMEQCRLEVVNPSTRITAVSQCCVGAQARLYEALGGESGLSELASLVVDSAREEPSIRKFFEMNQAKLATQKKNLAKFYQTITLNGGLLDKGVREQWEARLRTVHSLLNISDGNFDVEMEVTRRCVSSKYPSLKQGLVDEFINLVAQFRSSVSHGYRVRKEFAVDRLRLGDSLRLFRNVGGDAGIEKIVDRWICVLRNDPRVWSRYGSNIDEFRNAHVRALGYLVQHGGGDVYLESECLVVLKEMHAKFGTADYTFDVLVGDLEKAMVDLGFSQDIVNEVVIIVFSESLRDLVIFGGGSVERRKISTAKFRNGIPLWERIGEYDMEQWIDCSIDRVGGSERIRSYFDIPKSRLRAFKRKLMRFLSSEFGGPKLRPIGVYGQDPGIFGSNISSGAESLGGSTGVSPIGKPPSPGDASYIRDVHWKFNITDQVFDEFVGCMLSGACECGFEDAIVEDIRTVLNGLRHDVVIGWTMRSYKAVERIQEEPVTIYERLGGTSIDPGLDRFLGRLFELAERDKRISEFFTGSRSGAIRKAQGDYIASMLGGPISRSRPLDEVHRIYSITSHHFDCFLRNMMNSARDCGANADLIDEIVVTMEPLREIITAGTSPDNFAQLVNPAELQAI